MSKSGTEFITEGVDDPAAHRQVAAVKVYSAKALQQIYRPGFLIDPRHSKVMRAWDLIMLFALMFTAIITPYEVTFIEEGPCVTVLFMINRLIDLLFLMDMCVRCQRTLRGVALATSSISHAHNASPASASLCSSASLQPLLSPRK